MFNKFESMNFFHNSLKRKLVQQHTKKKIVNMAQRYNEILYRYITQCTFSIDLLEQIYNKYSST